jgi:ribonuclease-3
MAWKWWSDRKRARTEAAPRTPQDAQFAAHVERLTGTAPDDLELYRRALRHRSVLRGEPGGHLRSNERLEFLGDAVLEIIVSAHLFTAFPDADEGFLSRLRAKLVSGQALAESASACGLGRLLELSPEAREQGAERNTSILADALEAVIGALYLDHGPDAPQAFVHRVLLDERDLPALAARTDNYKSALLEYAQAQGWEQPTYRVTATEGEPHERTFTVEAQVNGRALGVGTATTKKAAEQQAAERALGELDA